MSAPRKSFASDNNSGVHPRIMEALAAANAGDVLAYGHDPITESALARFRQVFGPDCDVYFVFLGTAANVLCLRTLLRPHHAVICPTTAHINVDECGAPESLAGCKLFGVPSPDGKLRPADVAPFLEGLGFEHHNQPKCVSISQSAELGAIYSIEEIRELADFAHANGLYLHMDGARLANAAAALGTDLRSLTADAGVDALSFGGTKNGMMYGEAAVFFNPELSREAKYVRKQCMQLSSKMRFIAAQFEALLTDELWRENALNANRMAALLADAVAKTPGVRLTRPVQANAVFVELPPEAAARLQEEYFFYIWDASRHEARFMTSFDAAEQDVEAFANALKRAVA